MLFVLGMDEPWNYGLPDNAAEAEQLLAEAEEYRRALEQLQREAMDDDFDAALARRIEDIRRRLLVAPKLLSALTAVVEAGAAVELLELGPTTLVIAGTAPTPELSLDLAESGLVSARGLRTEPSPDGIRWRLHGAKPMPATAPGLTFTVPRAARELAAETVLSPTDDTDPLEGLRSQVAALRARVEAAPRRAGHVELIQPKALPHTELVEQLHGIAAESGVELVISGPSEELDPYDQRGDFWGLEVRAKLSAMASLAAGLTSLAGLVGICELHASGIASLDRAVAFRGRLVSYHC